MKLITSAIIISTATAFHVQRTSRAPQTLKMGFFDFKPIHGSGSGSADSDLDEQYRLQQEILKVRRDHINYDSLHKKYEQDKQDMDVFSLGEKQTPDKYQESYVEDEGKTASTKKFKFPWDLKP